MPAELWTDIRKRLKEQGLGGPAPSVAGEWRRAAVLVPLYEADGEVFVLLTRRTDTVEHHKGQISFPGGAADPDEDLSDTALRETFEETGIPAEAVRLLGRLPDVEVLVSGFRVTPYVGVVPYPYPLRLNADEIEEVLRVPLAAFRDPANLRMEDREREGRTYRVYLYSYAGQTVWGATARIMKHLVDLLSSERET